MGDRSLIASTEGIEVAKLALKRQKLTQKDLVYEKEIASWSTINKFFNSKPVDRPIFIEICQILNLDWKVIAGSLPETENQKQSSNPSPDLLAVQRQSNAARVALTPRILERIDRVIVQQKYLPAIQRGIREGMQRVIPIIAPAGYGKSTILGNIYDQLLELGESWVALVLCNSLLISGDISVENLAVVLGAAASGTQTSIFDIGSKLTAVRGRGVLLLDTLDLVINRAFVSAFTSILQQLLDDGMTIVFTCRDHEYNDFLEPNHPKIGAIAAAIDRYNVPEFTLAEIRQASATFFSKSHNREVGERLADKILTLSADNRSLQQIIRNPLLLALLCDLFAKDGNVPADLTVSKLYQRYWHEKIAYSRIDDSHTSILAIEKDNLCLAIAKALFEMSQEKLCESAYRDELGISFTENVAAAYDDLFSEGVLERLPSAKIHFFHQTLLEYSIAYWLTRHSAQRQRHQLLQTLNSSDTGCLFWYPVLRQLLTIVDETEFAAIVNQLDTNQMSVFRAVVFAAASRETPAALRQQLPVALSCGSAYQKILHNALASASTPLASTAWEVMLTLLCSGERTTASSAAQSIGALLNPWGMSVSERLEEAINAITIRTTAISERSQLYGWLIDSALPILSQRVDREALRVLRKHYHLFADGTKVTVISLHLAEGVSDTALLELYQIIKSEALPKRLDIKLKTELVNLVTKLLPNLLSEEKSGNTDKWLKFLHEPSQVGFDLVQAKAVGRYAVDRQNLLGAILQDLITGEKYHTTNNLLALSEAINCGGSQYVAAALIKISCLDNTRLKSVNALLNEIANTLDANQRELLINWVAPMAVSYLEQWLPSLIKLAGNHLKLQNSVAQLIRELPPENQTAQINHYLLQLNQENTPQLAIDLTSQLSYRQQAPTSREAIIKLIDLAVLDNKKTALAAATALVETLQITSLERDQKLLKVRDLLPLASSRFSGVRLQCIEAIAHQIKQAKQTFIDLEIREILTAFKDELEPLVIQKLCEIVAGWVDVNKSVPLEVADLIGNIPLRLQEQKDLLGAVAGAVIDTFNVLAQLEEPRLMPKLAEWTRLLFGSIDVKRVQESKVIALLALVARGNPHFLAELIGNECPSLPTRNIRAVALAIRRVEGIDSPLLARILESDWCHLEVKSLIFGFRGA